MPRGGRTEAASAPRGSEASEHETETSRTSRERGRVAGAGPGASRVPSRRERCRWRLAPRPEGGGLRAGAPGPEGEARALTRAEPPAWPSAWRGGAGRGCVAGRSHSGGGAAFAGPVCRPSLRGLVTLADALGACDTLHSGRGQRRLGRALTPPRSQRLPTPSAQLGASGSGRSGRTAGAPRLPPGFEWVILSSDRPRTSVAFSEE